MLGPLGNKGSNHTQDPVIFDPTLKVKEEETSDDETTSINKANGTFLTRSPSVKLQTLDERSLKRLLSKRTIKGNAPQQEDTGERHVHVSLPHQKSPFEESQKEKMINKRVNGLTHKATEVQRVSQIVQSKGFEKTVNGICEPQKEKFTNSNFSQGSFLTNDKSGNWTPYTTVADQRSSPFDLRQMIGSGRNASSHTTVSQSFGHHEKNTADDNEMDSMSIHAEDDLELDYNEDLNELGKHFEATNSVTASKEPGILASPNEKRRHSDRDDHSAKKSKLNVTPERFSRSQSSGEEREKHKSEYRRPSAASELSTHNDIGQNGLRVNRDRIYSDPENRKNFDPRRKDNENLQNHKVSTQNSPFFNNTRHHEHQRKFQGINAREQHVERRSFSKHHGQTPSRVNDIGLLGPGPMRGAHPNLSAGNDTRPFLTFPQFGVGSGIPIRPIGPHEVPAHHIRQFPMPMETGVNQNTHQMHQALDQKLTMMLQENNYGSCIQVCQEFINHMERVPLHYLETLLKTAAEGDVINLSSKIISFLFNQIRKVRATTGFRMEDFRFGVDAFVKVEDVDSAINLVFEMKRCGLSPSQTILLQIRNAIFATTVKSPNNLIKFCDELGTSSLFNKRLLEEVLKHVTFKELSAQAKCPKVLELLQEVKIQNNAATLHSTATVIPSEFLRVLKQIDEFSPQENIPSDLVVKLIQCISSTSEVLSVITKLSNFPKDVLLSVPSEVWNAFFIESCSGPFADVQYANQIHGIITDHDIPLSNKSLLEFSTLLLKDGKDSTSKAAVAIIDRIDLSDITHDDVTDNINETLLSMIGNKKLSSSYDYKIAMILTKSKRFLADEKLNDILSGLNFNSNYQEIHNIMLELEKADVKPSLETYELAVSSLEDWETNQEAFLKAIKAMKRNYPKHRIFKDRDTASIVSSLSHTSSSLPNTVSLPSPHFPTEAATHATPDKAKLIQSPPALPLKSPFEEALNSQQNNVSVRTRPEQASSGNMLTPKSTGIVEGLKLHGADQLTRPPPTSAQRSIECMDRPGYEQFYNEMVFAVQNRNTNEVFNVYIKLRHEEITIDSNVLLEMYKVLVENPSETFRQLTDVIRQEVPLVQAIDVEEPLFLFQDADQETLGRLGVRLLFHCLEQNECTEGFNLLFILHELNINYSLYGLGFGGEPNRTTCEITMTAVKICLGRDSPALDGAMQVLRGAEFAIPLNSEDDSERKAVFTKLSNNLLDQDEYDDAFELISHSSNDRGWSLNASECFNTTLLRLSEENSADRAMKVYQYMGKSDIAKDNKAFRAYLNCHARNGNIVYARELFEIGRNMEIYPSQELSDPYFFELPCNLTQVEMLFMLEEHLRKIKRTVYEGNGSIRPLLGSQSSFKIIFKENYELFETSNEQFAVARENLIVVLSEKVKPPLRIIDTENPDEPLVIGVDSILRWYEDKPDFKHTLSVTNDAATNTLHRKVEISLSEEPTTSAENPTATKEPQTSPINGLAVSNGPVRDKEHLTRVSNAICKRLKVYLHRGKVAQGKAFQDCTRTLIIQFLKLNKDMKFADDDIVQSHASSFVDNFFRRHESFVPKHT